MSNDDEPLNDERTPSEDDELTSVDRRTFLGGMAATAVGAVVGCDDGSSPGGEPDENDEQQQPSPSGGKKKVSSGDRPNILFVWSDDQSVPDLGAYGHPSIKTPNLDQLASDGMRFERAYVASPQCSPSRSAVMTGRFPHSTNTARLHAPLRNQFDNVLEPLQEAGYYVGSYRKVHLGGDFMKLWDFDGSQPGPFSHHDAEGVTFETFFDKRPEDRPFFLHVGLTEPHRPYEEGTIEKPHDPADVEVPDYLPDTDAVRKDLALYYDEMTKCDQHCGRLFELLDKHGLTDDTLVVFSADNGLPFPGGKGTLYEPAIHVPLLMRWPGNIDEGSVTDNLVSLVDLPATFLDAAGLDPMPRSRGRSLLPLIEGETASHRDAVFAERNWHDNLDLIRTVVTDRYKLIQNYQFHQPYRPTADIAESPSWKSLKRKHDEGSLADRLDRRYFRDERPRTEVYDLEEDPAEMNNLAGDSAREDRVQQLRETLSQWMLETDDYLPPVEGAFGGLDLDFDIITGP